VQEKNTTKTSKTFFEQRTVFLKGGKGADQKDARLQKVQNSSVRDSGCGSVQSQSPGCGYFTTTAKERQNEWLAVNRGTAEVNKNRGY